MRPAGYTLLEVLIVLALLALVLLLVASRIPDTATVRDQRAMAAAWSAVREARHAAVTRGLVVEIRVSADQRRLAGTIPKTSVRFSENRRVAIQREGVRETSLMFYPDGSVTDGQVMLYEAEGSSRLLLGFSVDALGRIGQGHPL